MADYTSTGIIHNTSVDFTRRVISEPVHIVQGDRTLPTLAVELLADGQPYTVPDGAQVNIALNKKDGTFVLNKADSVDGNIATFTITAQMAAVSGDFTPEVQIVNGAGQATTGKFPYIVDKAEIQEGMIESTWNKPINIAVLYVIWFISVIFAFLLRLSVMIKAIPYMISVELTTKAFDIVSIKSFSNKPNTAAGTQAIMTLNHICQVSYLSSAVFDGEKGLSFLKYNVAIAKIAPNCIT